MSTSSSRPRGQAAATQDAPKFIGLGRFQGAEQTLILFVATNRHIRDERRKGLTAVFKLGLVRYVAETPLADQLKVTFQAPAGLQMAAAVDDPWNFWVFRIGASGNFDGEESNESLGIPAFFSVNRTTDQWKINFNGSSRYSEDTFELEEEDGGTFTTTQRQSEGRVLVTKSINDHWSFGGTAVLLASTFQNYDLRTRVAPGIEFDIFPYSESTRRILTLFYSVGYQTADYTEETIFGKTEEQLLDHSFEVALALRQPWGYRLRVGGGAAGPWTGVTRTGSTRLANSTSGCSRASRWKCSRPALVVATSCRCGGGQRRPKRSWFASASWPLAIRSSSGSASVTPSAQFSTTSSIHASGNVGGL